MRCTFRPENGSVSYCNKCNMAGPGIKYPDRQLNTRVLNPSISAHMNVNLSGTKSQAKYSDSLAWKMVIYMLTCICVNFLARFGLTRALYRLDRVQTRFNLDLIPLIERYGLLSFILYPHSGHSSHSQNHDLTDLICQEHRSRGPLKDPRKTEFRRSEEVRIKSYTA